MPVERSPPPTTQPGRASGPSTGRQTNNSQQPLCTDSLPPYRCRGPRPGTSEAAPESSRSQTQATSTSQQTGVLVTTATQQTQDHQNVVTTAPTTTSGASSLLLQGLQEPMIPGQLLRPPDTPALSAPGNATNQFFNQGQAQLNLQTSEPLPGTSSGNNLAVAATSQFNPQDQSQAQANAFITPRQSPSRGFNSSQLGSAERSSTSLETSLILVHSCSSVGRFSSRLLRSGR